MEQNAPRCPLLVERAADWLVKMCQKNTLPILTTLIFGLLAYLYGFTNKLPNQDDIAFLFSKGATLDSGRWGLDILERIFPNYSMPWIYGILTLVILAAVFCLLIRTLEIKSKVLQVLLIGCILVSPFQIGTMLFIYTAPPYALSLLLTVTGIYLLHCQGFRLFPLAVLCTVLALSIYQAYIAVTAAFALLLLIRQLLTGRDLASVFKQGCMWLALLILSLLLYYGLTKVIQALRGTGFNNYSQAHFVFSLETLPESILYAYQVIGDFFDPGYLRLGIFPSVAYRNLFLICLGCCAILLVLLAARQKQLLLRSLFLAALLAVFPLAVNCMYLFSVPWGVHTIVLYGFVAVYALFVTLADLGLSCVDSRRILALGRRLLLNVLSIGLALIVAANIYLSNELFLGLHLQYENVYSFYTALMADIRAMPEFDQEARLAILGYYHEPAFYGENFPFANQIFGASNLRPDNDQQAKYLQYYIGISLPFATWEESQQILESQEFAEMPPYPYHGSIKAIDGVITVKLS